MPATCLWDSRVFWCECTTSAKSEFNRGDFNSSLKFSKVKEYSPSEAAKVYDKPVTRRNIPIFNPQSLFNECNKNPATRNTIQDHIDLANHFSKVSSSTWLSF